MKRKNRPGVTRATERPAQPHPAPGWFALNGDPEVPPAQAQLLARLGWLVAAISTAAALAMILGPHRIGDYSAESDFYGAYATGARLIQHGHLDPSRYGVIGPVYEILLAATGLLVGDLFRAAELISLGSALACLLLWGALLRRVAGARIALLGVLFIAANEYFFRYAYSATTDLAAVALQAGALFLLLAGRSGARSVAAAGVLAALAFLTRYNAIFLLPAGILAAALARSAEPRRLRACLAFASGFAAPVLPWIVYSLACGAHFHFQLHHNIAAEVYANARGLSWDDYEAKLEPQFRTLGDVIAKDPGAVASRMLFNLWDHLRQDARNLLGWPVAACAALGVFLAGLDARLRKLAPLWIAGILLYLSLVPVFYSERYGLALVPFYAALAGCALGSPLGALALGRAQKFWLKPALALVPLTLAVGDMKMDVSDSMGTLPTEVLDCARALKPLAAPGDRLIARKAHLAYYSGLEMRMFPRTQTLPELAAFAHKEGARWLFISQPEASTRLQYNYLLDTTADVPGLARRFTSRTRPAVLYEIGPDFGRLPAWMANDTLVMLHRYRGMLALVPNDPHTLYTLGKLEHTRGRLDEAARYLSRAEELNPKNARIPMALGDVQLSAGRPAEAAEQFQKVEDLEPGNLQARLGRGWATLLAGKKREAAEIWRPAIASTRQVSVLEEMAQLYHALGDSAAEAAAFARLAEVTQAAAAPPQ